MPANILDASALLAVFRDEPGAEVVLPLIVDSGTSSLNLSEVARKLFTEGWQREAIEDMFDALGLREFDLDLTLAIDAAEIERTTRRHGLSTADRVCLALANAKGRSRLHRIAIGQMSQTPSV